MITIKNVRTLDNDVIDYALPCEETRTIDANRKLILFPGIIDPHINLGAPEKEEWENTIHDLLKGGVTAIVEIPDRTHPANTRVEVEKKQKWIEKAKKNLHPFIYAKADVERVDELGGIKKEICGLVLQFEHDKEYHHRWDILFQRAAWENLPIIINAHNENRFETMDGETLIEKALFFAEKHSTRLFVLNVSNSEEIRIIQEARKRALLIYAETTINHLFQKNQADADALWEALDEGVIETIGSGYDAHAEIDSALIYKGKPYHLLNPLFLLPLLYTSSLDKKISLEKIVQATSMNIRDILELDHFHDAVLIDPDKEEAIEKINGTLSGQRLLRGWPVYTITQGRLIEI